MCELTGRLTFGLEDREFAPGGVVLDVGDVISADRESRRLVVRLLEEDWGPGRVLDVKIPLL